MTVGASPLTSEVDPNAYISGFLDLDSDLRLAGDATFRVAGPNDPDTFSSQLIFEGGAFGDEFPGTAVVDGETISGTFTLDGEEVSWTATPIFEDVPRPDPEGSAFFDVTTEITGAIESDGTEVPDITGRDIGDFITGELFTPQFRVEDPAADFVDGTFDEDGRERDRRADLVAGPDGEALLSIEFGRGIEGTGTLNADGSVTGTFTLEEDSFVNQDPSRRIITQGTFTATPKAP